MRSTSYATLIAIAALIPIMVAQTRSPTHKSPVASKPAAAAAPPACAAPVQYHPQPYIIRQQITRAQTLPNGTNINTIEDVFAARDPDGRSRRETTRNINGDTTHNVSVFDPTTQTRYSWNTGPGFTQTVNVYHVRPAAQTQMPASPSHRYYPSHSETLPPQTVAGVYVEGYRTTRTIPAGYDGNDHDLVTTSETWNAPDLGMVLRMVSDDPRNGKTTTDTTDLQLTVPDPSLFQPPPDYQLKDQN